MKPYDNTEVFDFLDGYIAFSEAREDYEWIDDIFSGALELKTEKNTATRSFSRDKLFTYISNSDSISAKSFQEMYPYYSLRTCQAYATLARIISKAMSSKISTAKHEQINKAAFPGLAESRRLVDQPYHAEIRPYGLVWPFQATKEWERPTDYQDSSEWDNACLPVSKEFASERTRWLVENMKYAP